MLLQFTKMQGLHNDFVVFDNRICSKANIPNLAILLCHRRTGVGSDGLVVIDKPINDTDADFMYRHFNSEGGLSFCGNGLRCAIRFCVEHKIVDSDDMTIETTEGTLKAKVHRDHANLMTDISVEMPKAKFDKGISSDLIRDHDKTVDYEVEVDGKMYKLTTVQVGSLHTIIFADELPRSEEFHSISPKIVHHTIFPHRTQVMWCKQEEDPNRLAIRPYEVVGPTEGWGTGSCAAAMAAVLTGRIKKEGNKEIIVQNPGGQLKVSIHADGTIHMRGPAEHVFHGVFDC